jgi:hypothetical protein
MDRRIFVTGLALAAAGLAVFVWKAFVLDLPVLPDHERDVWEAQFEVAIRGADEQGSVFAVLPRDGPGQRIFGEHFSSNGLDLEIRSEQGNRLAVWRGPVGGVDRVSYRFNVQLFPIAEPLAEAPVEALDAEAGSAWLRTSPALPSTAPAVRQVLEELDLPAQDDPRARLRAIHAFAAHEISASDPGSDDALIRLAQRTGSDRGRERLLVTLLRAAGIPARPVRGLALRESEPRLRIWVEALVDGRWLPLSGSGAFFGRVPPATVRMSTGDQELVRSIGTDALGYEYAALREGVSARELASLMLPPSPTLRAHAESVAGVGLDALFAEQID